MTEIWFIRHGETDWNRQRRLQGWQDIPLNKAAGGRPRNWPRACAGAVQTRFDALYSSDLRAPAIPPSPWPSSWTCASAPSPASANAASACWKGWIWNISTRWPRRRRPPGRAAIPLRPLDGGETLGQFQSRVISTVDDIAARHGGERIMLFTHGGVLDIVWRHASGVRSTPARRVDAECQHQPRRRERS